MPSCHFNHSFISIQWISCRSQHKSRAFPGGDLKQKNLWGPVFTNLYTPNTPYTLYGVWNCWVFTNFPWPIRRMPTTYRYIHQCAEKDESNHNWTVAIISMYNHFGLTASPMTISWQPVNSYNVVRPENPYIAWDWCDIKRAYTPKNPPVKFSVYRIDPVIRFYTAYSAYTNL